MICRECGNDVRELYSCRICEGNGLCMECAVLCEDELPFPTIVTTLTAETEDAEC